MPASPVTPGLLMRDIADAIEFFTEVVEARKDLADSGQALEELCTHYRAMGICLLSDSADTDGFFHYLVQSALTRRYYLNGVALLGGGAPFHRRASFLDPVFDAVAARQWRLAAEILKACSQDWSEGEEYEDDYCYAAAVRLLVVHTTSENPGIEEILVRWNSVLAGSSDLRLDVVRALAARDPDAFAAALRALLDSSEAEARADADPITGSLRADETTFFPNRWVRVEGLALLALAERHGLTAKGEFLACPPLARVAVFSPFSSRGFPAVPYSNE